MPQKVIFKRDTYIAGKPVARGTIREYPLPEESDKTSENVAKWQELGHLMHAQAVTEASEENIEAYGVKPAKAEKPKPEKPGESK